MSVRLVIDSTSDVPIDIIKKNNIEVAPLTVHFGEESYLDKIEITQKEFYQKLSQSEKLPTTSQVAPGEFVKIFNEILAKGDEVLGIFIGTEISGTYDSACIAKDMVQSEKIRLIDSRSACLGTFTLIIEAIKMIDEGKSLGEIADTIESFKDKIEVIIGVDTLKYLEKGGRLSKGAAVVGTILNVKPMLTIKDSKITVIDKVRGKNKVIKRIDQWIEENKFDLTDKEVVIVHTESYETLKNLREAIENKYKIKQVIESEVGCVIGTHVGPGCVAIAFLNK